MPRISRPLVVAFAALLASGCGSGAYNRASLAEDTKRTEAVSDLSLTISHGDPAIYQGPQALTKLGVLCLHVGAMAETRKRTETQKSITTLKIGLDWDNLRVIADNLERHLIAKLAAQGHQVTPTVEMKKAAAYAGKGDATQGVSERNQGFKLRFYDTVAADGNIYNGTAAVTTITTDDDWSGALRTQTGVDAFVIVGLGTNWELQETSAEQDGVKGVQYGISWKPVLQVLVPFSKMKEVKEAIGQRVPWVANNDVLTIMSEDHFGISLFLPTNDDSEAARAANEKSWKAFEAELQFSLDLCLERLKQATSAPR